jgi:hypothetical protein
VSELTVIIVLRQTILYGAEQSSLFPGQVWGGMSADIAVFTQTALGLTSLLQQWDPAGLSQWRIFSKLGGVTCPVPATVVVATTAERVLTMPLYYRRRD